MKYKNNGVVLRMELASDLPRVLGERVQSQRVILDLVMDGIEAMGGATDRSRELLINPFNMNPTKYSWQCKTPDRAPAWELRSSFRGVLYDKPSRHAQGAGDQSLHC